MSTLWWNFDITIGKDACEACKTTSNLHTNSALALASRKTTENLDRVRLYRSRSRSCFTTDGQSVNMSWYRAPLWDLRPCRNVTVRNLWFCFCGGPSLTRGRVCNLQCRVAQNPWPYFTVSSETLPTWRARFPYLYPPGTGWSSYTPGHWVYIVLAAGPLYVASAWTT
jgi:hypothetical protein